MPLHDWSRVRHGMFHHFHNAWIYRLADLLNGGVLPSGFYAAGEQVAGDVEPDVVTLGQDDDRQTWDHTGAIAVAERPPHSALQDEAQSLTWIRKQDQLAIRRVGDDRLIAVIEIVSPANKSSRKRLSDFVEKIATFLLDGVHVLVVDVFPSGRLDPAGLHTAIWEDVTGETPSPLAHETGTLAAYAAGNTLRAYVEPARAGSKLVDMPLFLEEGWYVLTPLENAYAATWENYPKPWKTIVES